MKKIAETNRLYLRELTMEDFDDLLEILSDPESMIHYRAPFDEERVRRWIRWSIESYEKYDCGLWAVILKQSGECIGDCGITTQEIEGKIVKEIGYHIKKHYCGMGLATEAAIAARDYGFEKLGFERIISYMTPENLPSRRVAEKNGMHFVKVFEMNGRSQVMYEITNSNKTLQTTSASARV